MIKKVIKKIVLILNIFGNVVLLILFSTMSIAGFYLFLSGGIIHNQSSILMLAFFCAAGGLLILMLLDLFGLKLLNEKSL